MDLEAERTPTDPRGTAGQNVSKLFRHLGDFSWTGLEAAPYKSEEGSWEGVSRRVFVGESGESAPFHVRYFEVASGGHTTLEQHLHEHAVVVIRGRGKAILAQTPHDLDFGDVVYVAPDEVHQFSNPYSEPFGFLCMVAAVRDRPRPVQAEFGSSCS